MPSKSTTNRCAWSRAVRLALAVATLAWSGACTKARPSSATTPQERLLDEFTGSYPAAAHPNGTVRTFDIVAAPARVSLGGRETTEVWAYNGQVPGPTLRVRLGETVRVRFTNRLPQATTIHWHGVRVPNAMDGVPSVTQPPVEPGGTFVYEFTPKDAGTFWFHPHCARASRSSAGSTACSSSRTPSPPPYSQDVVWVLDDWLLDEHGQIFPEFNTRARPGARRPLGQRHHRQRAHVDACSRARRASASACAWSTRANGRVFKPDFGALDAEHHRRRRPVPARAASPTAASSSRPATGWTSTSRLPRRRQRHVAGRRPLLCTDAATTLAVIRRRRRRGRDAAASRHRRTRTSRSGREGLALPVTKQFRLNARRGGEYGIEWTINEQAFRPRHRPRTCRPGARPCGRALPAPAVHQRLVSPAPHSPPRDVLPPAGAQRRAGRRAVLSRHRARSRAGDVDVGLVPRTPATG